MTTKPTIHIPQKDSPQTYLAESINTSDTILTLTDSSIFEAAGITRLTLGFGTSQTETVTVVSYEANDEIVVVRGSPAYSWLAETPIARVFTAADLSEVQQYLDYLDERFVTNSDKHDPSDGDGLQIPTGGIANLAVTNAKIAANTILAGNIASGAIEETKLATSAVTTNKVADDAITNAKLADPYDYYYYAILDPSVDLEVADDLASIFIVETHNGKSAVKLWAGIPGDVSSSGDITIRFYDKTLTTTIGTVTISQGNKSGTATVSYLLATDKEIRIDCTGAGTGAKGLQIQIKVDKS